MTCTNNFNYDDVHNARNSMYFALALTCAQCCNCVDFVADMIK